jgi:hypothetical protein
MVRIAQLLPSRFTTVLMGHRLLIADEFIEGLVRGEQHHGYTFVSALPDNHDHPLMPYNPEGLHQCG